MASQVLVSGGKVMMPEGRLADGLGVVIADGRISTVAPIGQFADWAGDRIDTTGATLLPGLIDCHVHLVYAGEPNPGVILADMKPGPVTMRAFENALTTLRGGITALRDCGGREYLEFAVRDACNAGRVLGPTIRAAGRMVCMTGGHGNRFGRVADGVDEVIKAVREQIHAGSDFIKIMATGGVMTPGVNPEDAHYTAAEMAAGIAEGHRFHKHCASHAQGTEGILNAVRGGVDSIEHGIFMDDHCVNEMIERGTTLVPTVSALFNILRNAERIPAYIVDKTRRVADRHRDSLLRFHAAGGKIAMGTDAGTPFNFHGENALELAYMVELGIPARDALLSATVRAADLLRLPDRGRIAEGMVADLLLVEGDPLENIRQVAERRHHRFVMLAGQIVPAKAN